MSATTAPHVRPRKMQTASATGRAQKRKGLIDAGTRWRVSKPHGGSATMRHEKAANLI